MKKKIQNFAGWLVLIGLYSLQTGCAVTQSGDSSSQVQASAQDQTKKLGVVATEKNTQSKGNTEQSPEQKIAEKMQQSAEAKPQSITQAETQKELSGEVLYYLLSAEIAGQRGQVALSAVLYTKAAELTRDVNIAQQATRAAFYARDDKRAIIAAKLWNELEPNNIEAHQVLAALLVRAGETDAAVEHFEYVISHSKHDERQGFMFVTSMLSKEKDKESALKVMERLIEKRKNNPNALFSYSKLAFLTGSLDIAVRNIERVIQLQPDWTDAYILQANIFVRQGYKAHSLVVLRKAVEEHSDNSKLRMFYARSLVDAKQFDEATNQFDELTSDPSLEHEARYALGLLALQMNKPAKAQDHFITLIKDKKHLAESQYYLAQTYELQNKLTEALLWYKKIRHNQYTFEAELRIALILAKQGQLEEARIRLQNISPDTLDKELRVYLAEGEMLNEAKQYEEAIALYTEALLQLTDNSRLLYARALTAEKLDRVDDAVKDLESIVERDPVNAQALNALGYTLIDKTAEINKGLGYVKKALKLEPNDPAILDSMGWAYYRLGQYDEALKYLRRAFAQLNDAEIAAHLGEVLWVAGQREEAQEIWSSALQQAPNDDLLLNVIQKFSE